MVSCFVLWYCYKLTCDKMFKRFKHQIQEDMKFLLLASCQESQHDVFTQMRVLFSCRIFTRLSLHLTIQDPRKNELCYEKTNFEVFVVVIPKEGWARVSSFGMTPTFQNLTLVTP